MEDPTLKGLVTPNPQITFRKAGSIGGMLKQSEHRGNLRSDPCRVWGTFSCGACSFCEVIGKRTFFTLHNGERFHLRHFANCKTQGVVYLLQCECGKTQRELGQWISKHLQLTITIYTSLFADMWTRDIVIECPKSILWYWIECMSPPGGGGYWNKIPLSVWDALD